MGNYEKLKGICLQIDNLIALKVVRSSNEFQIWLKNTRRFLCNCFGENSIELREFNKLPFDLALVNVENWERVEKCKNDLEIAKGMFENYLEDMESDTTKDTDSIKDEEFNKVFIVHGHDTNLKLEVARLLENQGIEAIILHEQVNAGMTIMEKIESYGNTVNAAIILFTPDDDGKAKKEEVLKSRARQNVVFEAGYFAGLLGRNRTILIISDDNIELPGDLSGIVYNKEFWQFKVIQELKKIGFDVDANKLMI